LFPSPASSNASNPIFPQTSNSTGFVRIARIASASRLMSRLLNTPPHPRNTQRLRSLSPVTCPPLGSRKNKQHAQGGQRHLARAAGQIAPTCRCRLPNGGHHHLNRSCNTFCSGHYRQAEEVQSHKGPDLVRSTLPSRDSRLAAIFRQSRLIRPSCNPGGEACPLDWLPRAFLFSFGLWLLPAGSVGEYLGQKAEGPRRFSNHLISWL